MSLKNYKYYFFTAIIFIFMLFISNIFIQNNFRDNILYNEAYILFKKHTINNNDYYILPLYKSEIKKENRKSLYLLIDKRSTNFTKYFKDNLLEENNYVLVKFQKKNSFSKYNHICKITKKLSIQHRYKIYKIILGTTEPVFFLVSSISSIFLNYNSFILLLNSIFLILLLLISKKFIKEKYIFFFLLFAPFNYYLYIFMSELHRLKLGFIFFFLYYISVHNSNKISFFILSVLSHLQMSILYFYMFILKYKSKQNLIHLIKSNKLLTITVSVIIIIMMIFMKDDFIYKIHYYWHGEIQFKTLVIGVVYVIYGSYFKEFKSLKLFFPLFILVFCLAFIVGGDRLNFILIEFILIFETLKLLQNKKSSLILLAPLTMYNFYKIVEYILKSNGQA